MELTQYEMRRIASKAAAICSVRKAALNGLALPPVSVGVVKPRDGLARLVSIRFVSGEVVTVSNPGREKVRMVAV